VGAQIKAAVKTAVLICACTVVRAWPPLDVFVRRRNPAGFRELPSNPGGSTKRKALHFLRCFSFCAFNAGFEPRKGSGAGLWLSAKQKPWPRRSPSRVGKQP